jgi:hypothetical protein
MGEQQTDRPSLAVAQSYSGPAHGPRNGRRAARFLCARDSLRARERGERQTDRGVEREKEREGAQAICALERERERRRVAGSEINIYLCAREGDGEREGWKEERYKEISVCTDRADISMHG